MNAACRQGAITSTTKTVKKPSMDLSSGVYTIENVQNRNWAILANDNDGDDVLSGDTDSGHKVERLPFFFDVG
jgi:hypothetical protein